MMTQFKASANMSEYDKLLMSQLVQHKCTFYLYQLMFSFIKYYTDFKSWLVVFSISFTLEADFQLKFSCNFFNCPSISYKLHYLSTLIIPFFIKCSIHSASTLTLYFISALSEKYFLSFSVDLAYLPSRGDKELKLEADSYDIIGLLFDPDSEQNLKRKLLESRSREPNGLDLNSI